MSARRSARCHALFLAALASTLAAGPASADPFVWDGNGSDSNWSTGANWLGDPAAGPAAVADTILFNQTGTAVLANTVDAGLTGTSFTSLNYIQTDPSKTYVTTIAPGVTLSLANPNSPSNTQATAGNAALLVMPPTATATVASAVIRSATPGSGAVSITDGNVLVTGRPLSTTTDSAGILDMSQLHAFTYSRPSGTGVFNVGGGFGSLNDDEAYWGKVTLGANTYIDSNIITIGGQSGAQGGGSNSQPLSTLILGSNNNLNGGAGTAGTAGAIYVGADPIASKTGSGGIIHGIGLAAPVTTIGDATHLNALQIGASHVNNSTGHSSFGVIDFTSASGMNANAALRVSDGTVNASFSTVLIGKGPVQSPGAPSIAPTGSGVGMFSFDKGTVTATTVQLGVASFAANNGPNIGHLNVGLKGDASDFGGGSFTASTITLGEQTTGTTGSSNLNVGVLNVANAGAVTADKLFVGSNTSGTARVLGVLNLGSGAGGGTVTTHRVQAGSNAAQAGTPTRLVNFNGGTLQVKTGTAGDDADNFLTGMTAAYVYSGGGTIDTNGADVTIAQPLLAPTGNGVSAINITSAGSGYRIAPVVHVSGGGGTGATAVAKINSNGTLHSVVVTNPGTGYTAAPTVQLIANGAISAFGNMVVPYGGAAAVTSAAITSNTSAPAGGITKSNLGTLTLTGTSTFAGPTLVSGGKLVVGVGGSGSLANSDVTVGANAALGGSGLVKSITIQAGGHGAPGNSIGTQSASALTLVGGSHLDFEFAAPGETHAIPGSSDRYAVTSGAASIAIPSSGVLLNLLGSPSELDEGSYKLVSYTDSAPVANFVATTGTISGGVITPDSNGSIALGSGWSSAGNFSYTILNDASNGGIFLDLAPAAEVPEPASLAVLAVGSLALLARRRRSV